MNTTDTQYFIESVIESFIDARVAAEEFTTTSDYSAVPATPSKKVTPMKTPKSPKTTTRRIYGLFANREALPFYIGCTKLPLSQRLDLHRSGNRPTRQVISDFDSEGYTVTIQEVAQVNGTKFEANAAEANVYNYYASKGAQMMNDPSKFSKVTSQALKTIRLLAKHGVKMSSIAKEVGLTVTAVRDVIKGNTFRKA